MAPRPSYGILLGGISQMAAPDQFGNPKVFEFVEYADTDSVLRALRVLGGEGSSFENVLQQENESVREEGERANRRAKAEKERERSHERVNRERERERERERQYGHLSSTNDKEEEQRR
ncbi:hypothetical protein RhiirC2_858032 [Rhizophagus irregularis]|uniref:Uncharacterized protein n=1 Tax=Rhizophagus irregularis TaxID=588596 RepID=A0A2N1M8B9_9GLOM|nr:hypothetical protein RhiirC2_858032 [Rhizophagus irregularis]